MKTLILALALTSTAFAEDSFKLVIRPEGNYVLNIKQTFKKEVSLHDIFIKGYFDSVIQQKSDPVVWKFQTTPSMKNLVTKGGGKFNLEVLFGKSIWGMSIKKTVPSSCNLMVNARSIRAICGMDLEDGKSRMDFSCSINADETKSCTVTNTGITKRIKILFKLFRSSAELAVSGSNISIKGAFKAKYALEGGDINEINKDLFYSRNVEPFFRESNEQFVDHYIEKPLTIMSTPQGLKFQ